MIVGPTGWGPEPATRHDTDGVVFAGSVPGPVLAELYRRARAFAYVPLTEGYGLPPLEAMRAGTPIGGGRRGAERARPRRGGPGAGPHRRPARRRRHRGRAGAVLTDDALRADLAARGCGARAGAHAGRPRRASTSRCGGRCDDDRLGVSRSTSPPSRLHPGGAGYYTMALASGLSAARRRRPDPVARRGDEERWRELAAGAAVRAAVPGSRPGRLAFEQIGLSSVLRSLDVQVHHGPHYTMPARSPVPCAVTIHDCTFFDHPEWHLRSKAAFFRRAIRRAAATPAS